MRQLFRIPLGLRAWLSTSIMSVILPENVYFDDLSNTLRPDTFNINRQDTMMIVSCKGPLYNFKNITFYSVKRI